MHDQVLMGKLDGLAYALEENEALGNGEVMLFAKSMDRNSIDVFHHQEGLSLAGDSPIQQPCDQRMVEPGEDLAFEPEPFSEKVGGQGQINQLDGDLLIEIAIRAVSHIDGAHAAAPDEPVNLIGSDAGLLLVRACMMRLPQAGGGEQLFLGAGFEKRMHFGHEGGVSPARCFNQSLPIALGQRQRLIEDGFDSRQHFGRSAHG